MEPVELAPWLAGGSAVLFLLYAGTGTHVAGQRAWLLPAGLSAAFLVWSLMSVAREGPFGFWAEHTRNLWGNQIWFDLLFAVAIAWSLIVPKAQALGMRVWVWMIFVVTTGCIGLLAMMARYLYLNEGQP